ncbi:hypothetical protein LMG3412_06280 [Achromobacter deleyi]|nr:hypothetical protein LMG3412_06280 [Achromobacter deleyi]
MLRASTEVAPRKLVTTPFRSEYGPRISPDALLAAVLSGLTAPPTRRLRSPPPVETRLPSGVIRPVLPTASTRPWLPGYTMDSVTSGGRSTPASPSTLTDRLPPPSVPIPVKPSTDTPPA